MMLVSIARRFFTFNADVERHINFIPFAELAADAHAVGLACTEKAYNLAIAAAMLQNFLNNTAFTPMNRFCKLFCYPSVLHKVKNAAQLFAGILNAFNCWVIPAGAPPITFVTTATRSVRGPACPGAALLYSGVTDAFETHRSRFQCHSISSLPNTHHILCQDSKKVWTRTIR